MNWLDNSLLIVGPLVNRKRINKNQHTERSLVHKLAQYIGLVMHCDSVRSPVGVQRETKRNSLLLFLVS